MITGIELIQVIIGINLFSYIFQWITVGFEEHNSLKRHLSYFIIFMFGGIYFINVGASRYTELNRNSSDSFTSEEDLDQMRDALSDLKDSMEDDN